jgi:hypothetical protein
LILRSVPLRPKRPPANSQSELSFISSISVLFSLRYKEEWNHS